MSHWKLISACVAIVVAGWFFAPLASAADPEVVTVFMIGDSTMADKPVIPENPERGWGQLLPLYFNSTVKVDNHAVNGRSSKSFRDEGRWDVVLGKLKPGDCVIIQFGHNDEKEAVSIHTDPFGSYTENLRRYAQETTERKAHPILATPVVRRNFNDQGVLQPTHGEYPAAVRKLAEEIKVPLLEMETRSHELLTKLGKERSEQLFIWTLPGEYQRFPRGNSDNTHFNALGATRMCDLAVAEIQEKIPELAGHLKGGRR